MIFPILNMKLELKALSPLGGEWTGQEQLWSATTHPSHIMILLKPLILDTILVETGKLLTLLRYQLTIYSNNIVCRIVLHYPCDETPTDPLCTNCQISAGAECSYSYSTNFLTTSCYNTTSAFCYGRASKSLNRNTKRKWDDLGRFNFDGCSSNWEIEDDYHCSFSRSLQYGQSWQLIYMTPFSPGNRVVDFNEEWDDGNTVDGDGCSSTSQLETNYVWERMPTDDKNDT